MLIKMYGSNVRPACLSAEDGKIVTGVLTATKTGKISPSAA